MPLPPSSSGRILKKMKTRRFTAQELMSVDSDWYYGFFICLKAGAYRLMGIDWEEEVSWYLCPLTGDIVFEYD